jgi:NADH-quinone oxidoreductase subunit G/NADP-reducing hydrogenase subunit HndD
MDKNETEEVKAHRSDSIYKIDKNMPVRKSHKNKEVQALYDEYLVKPNSHRAHELLHTHYVKRDRF